MSWLIEHKNNKYRFWSTILDKYITSWLTKKDSINFIATQWKKKLEKKIEEEKKYFPRGWCDIDGKYY